LASGQSATASSATEPTWLTDLRKQATDRFREIPMPVQKDKRWEFTDLSGFDPDAWEPATDGDLDARPARDAVVPADGSGVLQVNGTATRRGDIPDGVVVTTLAEAVAEHPALVEPHLGALVRDRDKFAAQNTAAWRGGLFVHVPAGTVLDQPIVASVIHASRGALPWRSLIVVDPGAQVTVAEEWLSCESGLEGYFNPVTEIVVGEGASLEYLCVQDLSEKAWILGSQRAQVARDASLHWVGLGLGSGQGKLRMETDINGSGASARVTGAYAGHGRQHIDYDTTQEHAAPYTTSDLAFRGVLRDRATAVWSGMIKVDPGAQRTDAFQESRNLLMNDGAHADAIPGLEIEANDVRCTHAATVARLDEAQIFYLRSRGITRPDAERLLVGGFLEVIAGRLQDSPFLHDTVQAALQRELEIVLA
jgi:Fe-S cluster assembly protein SufD